MMTPIWFKVLQNSDISFYEKESESTFNPVGTYSFRKATFVYPKSLYDWQEMSPTISDISILDNEDWRYWSQ